MKTTVKLTLFFLLAFGVLACNNAVESTDGKKLTYEDMKKAEASLFNADQSMNLEAAPKVAETYCEFVKQNPNDSLADEWLFHAMEINVQLKESEKCIALCNQLTEQYPQSVWAPRSLFLLGSFVYDDQLNDTAQAHVTFQRLIDEYPDSRLVEDAKKSIEYLGLSPEEIMALIMMSQMEEEEGDL